MKKGKLINWLLIVVAMYAMGVLAAFSYFSYLLWIGGGQNLTKVEEKHVYIEEPKLAEAEERVKNSLLEINSPKKPEIKMQGLLYSSDGVVLVYLPKGVTVGKNEIWLARAIDGSESELESLGASKQEGFWKFKIWKKGEMAKAKDKRQQLYNWPILEMAKLENIKLGQNVFTAMISLEDQNLRVDNGLVSHLIREVSKSEENPNDLIYKNVDLEIADIVMEPGKWVFDLGGQLVGVIGKDGQLVNSEILVEKI